MKICDLVNAPQWLKNAKTENEDVEISEVGHVTWLEGTWCGGTWLEGTWREGTWRGGIIKGKKAVAMRSYVGLYRYCVMAVLYANGERVVRMGCLFKSLKQWKEKGGIRKSNLLEFPDDGSDKSEERVAAFGFAKAAALRLKAPNA